MKREICIKSILRNSLIFDLYDSYRTKFLYGYIHNRIEVKHLLKRLLKNKPKTEVKYSDDKEDIFIFIGDKFQDSTMRKSVFGDIDSGKVKEHKCVFFTTHKLKDNKINFIHDLYWKINKIMPLPGKILWEKHYTTDYLKIENNFNYFFVFLAGGYFEETFSQPRLLKKIAEASKVTFSKRILYLVDPADKFPTVKYWFPYFDKVFSCAYDDQNRNQIPFIDTPCTKHELLVEEKKYDVYFRGMDNGRKELIETLATFFEENNIKCSFYIYTNKNIENMDIRSKSVHMTNDRITYEKMLEEEMKASVLLEVVVPGVGSGATLRYREAVIYGKKLLTNNPSIKSMPFYNKVNMCYFSDIKDIDLEWLRSGDIISYNYINEFSTDCFCDKIKAESLNNADN